MAVNSNDDRIEALHQLYNEYKDGIKMKQSSDVLKWAEGMGGLRLIECEDQIVGFLAVIRGCAEALYVRPEFRRRGLAKKAVQAYLEENGNRSDAINSIHLMHTGSAAREAMRFWNELFKTERVESTLVDAYFDVLEIR